MDIKAQDGILLTRPLKTGDLCHEPELRLLGLLRPLMLLNGLSFCDWC